MPVETAARKIRDRVAQTEQEQLEALRAAIQAGLDSGPGRPAEEVFAELEARYSAMINQA